MISDVHREGGRDPHDVLGVPRGADRQQVMRAFHRKARSGGHPDTGGNAQTFAEIISARDVLLEQVRLAAYRPNRRTAQATTAPDVNPRPAYSPPKDLAYSPPTETSSPPTETSRLAVATAVLALLGPLFWPVAIIVGHIALRQIKRTGQGGGTLVPVVLFFLYILTLPVLLRILSLLLIP
jgi:hypothetical protein